MEPAVLQQKYVQSRRGCDDLHPRPTGRRGSFLNTRMSYLKFRVQNTGTDAAHTIAANFNIASIFSRLELYYGLRTS